MTLCVLEHRRTYRSTAGKWTFQHLNCQCVKSGHLCKQIYGLLYFVKRINKIKIAFATQFTITDNSDIAKNWIYIYCILPIVQYNVLYMFYLMYNSLHNMHVICEDQMELIIDFVYVYI